MRLARVLLALALLSALAVPAAGHAASCENPLTVDLVLGDTAVLTAHLDLTGCGDPEQLLPIDLQASLSRSGPSEARAVSVVTLCQTLVCDIEASLARPPVEVDATYRGSVGYRSQGPGPQIVAGGESLSTTCALAVPSASIGVCV